jgi:hypothetical protein
MKYVLPTRSSGVRSVHRLRPMISRDSNQPATGRSTAAGTKYTAFSMNVHVAPSREIAPVTA